MSAYEQPNESTTQEALKKLALGQWLTAAERECLIQEMARLRSELGRERYLRELAERIGSDAGNPDVAFPGDARNSWLWKKA